MADTDRCEYREQRLLWFMSLRLCNCNACTQRFLRYRNASNDRRGIRGARNSPADGFVIAPSFSANSRFRFAINSTPFAGTGVEYTELSMLYSPSTFFVFPV